MGTLNNRHLRSTSKFKPLSTELSSNYSFPSPPVYPPKNHLPCVFSSKPKNPEIPVQKAKSHHHLPPVSTSSTTRVKLPALPTPHSIKHNHESFLNRYNLKSPREIISDHPS